jgi:hypothetical protein
MIARQEEKFRVTRHQFVEAGFDEIELIGEVASDYKQIVGEIGA